MTHHFDQDGFEIAPTLLIEDEIKHLIKVLDKLKVAPGHRNLMKSVPEIGALAIAPKIMCLMERMLGRRPFPVRSLFFDKTPEANWLVPWHQDFSIAVQERREVPGYGPWSVKDGIPHVQPPMEILEAMATIRIHLDDCGEANGALRVIPGSHRDGRLNASGIGQERKRQEEFTCSVRAGDALIMRPLLLHASSESLAPFHRRIIHLEYATCSLAKGLEWAETVG